MTTPSPSLGEGWGEFILPFPRRERELEENTIMPDILLRMMDESDWPEVADLIHVSTNYWYQRGGKPPIFTCRPEDTQLFCRVYEALDPGCCVLAIAGATGLIAGSCLFHPRPTHVSLGIMNVHPNYFGRHVASRLLKFVTDFADAQGKPTRLVSSAMNLDSYSLYTRAGFVPRATFADMYLPVPKDGLSHQPTGATRVRPATPNDASAIAALEMELAHIQRDKDYRYFLENNDGIWHASVNESPEGTINGFLVSVKHAASNMLGPGLAGSEEVAAALILAELDHHRGRSPVFLVPVQSAGLVRQLYSWGAKNCEIHFAQVRGEYRAPTGIVMPTFMPETG
ncbi:MAG: Acetyltransferase [Streptosporangiaceae bacterium]|nr:Acetyltransferase [Streptosporangiaceae bacterium]